MDIRKLVVIGSNAFSAQDFIDLALDETDAEIIGISRSAEKPAPFLRYRQNPACSRFRFHRMDINRDFTALAELLDRERPDCIVNFAAQSEVGPSWDHPEQWFATNCVALARLVNHLRGCDYLERYLHISSPEAYGSCSGQVTEETPDNPSTPYAASKAAADMLIETYRRQFGFPALTVRSTNVYGARQQLFKIVPRSVIYMRQGWRIPLHGGGVAVKSYIHIRDISAGELTVLQRGGIGKRYHLSPDRGIGIRDLVATIARRMGRELSDVADIVDERPGQDAAYVISSARARGELGWKPRIALEEGIGEVVDWIGAHWDFIQTQELDYVHRP